MLIDLYTWNTPNGRKVSIMLEETGLPYKVIPIDIAAGDQHSEDYVRIAPNHKIPAIVDHQEGISLMESAAILMYLAGKTGQFHSAGGTRYWEEVQWLMFQMGQVGPMLGQKTEVHLLGKIHVFLLIPLGDNFFMEPGTLADDMVPEHGKHPLGLETKSIAYHAVLLIITLVAIVLLSKKFGVLVDQAIVMLGAPKALGGIVIALLVLAPEGLAAFRAAAENHLQRAVNIALGSALATISLTVPAVVVIALFTGTHLILGVERAELVLLLLTLVISIITFSGPRTNVLGGIVHLVIFAVYLILIFDP